LGKGAYRKTQDQQKNAAQNGKHGFSFKIKKGELLIIYSRQGKARASQLPER
jgi:hypothetical protein